MTRSRAKSPATPEEALKTLPITDEQRNMLISGMQEIREEVLNYEGLAEPRPP